MFVSDIVLAGWDVAIAEGFVAVHDLLVQLAASHPQLKLECSKWFTVEQMGTLVSFDLLVGKCYGEEK